MIPDPTLVRVNYFFGQILSVDDLQAEQDYFIARLQRHNRYLHGWGIVSGLTVSMASDSEVTVSPGFAIDCMGREIHVPEPVRLTIPAGLALCFVVLGYNESGSAAAPVTTGEPQFTRTIEGFGLDIVSTDPSLGHKGHEVGTPGCGSPHNFSIARLKLGPRGWKLRARCRRGS